MAEPPKPLLSQTNLTINPQKITASNHLAQGIGSNKPAQKHNYSIVPQNPTNSNLTENKAGLQFEQAPSYESQFYPLKLIESNNIQNNSFLSKHQDSKLIQLRIAESIKAQISKYFDKCKTEIQHFDHYGSLASQVNNRIGQQIQVGQLKLNGKRKQLDCKRSGEKWKLLEAKKRMIQQQKYDMIRKLKTIQQQEVSLAHQSILQLKNKSVQVKKSQYTKEEKQAISSILKRNESFQKLLQQKTQQYIANKIMAKQLQEDELKKQNQHKNELKKKEIERRLKQMELKSEQRKKILQNSIVKADRKYIHKEIQKKYRSLQHKHEKQIEQKLRHISEKHKLNIDSINEHDKKYAEHLQKRSKSLSLIPTNQSRSRLQHHTYFRKVIEEEIFEAKERNYQRLMKLKQHQYHTKIIKYQQKVDKQYRPKVDTSKSVVIVPKTVLNVSLTKQERDEKGLQYLAMAKQLRKSQEDIVEPPKEVQNYGYKAYKDYLTHNQDMKIDATKKQLRQILQQKDDERDFNSILRAKFLAQGLSAKCKKVGDDKLYYSAKTKLSLLSQLYD